MHPPERPNPDPSPDALEARLRALPQLPAPAELEARLLADIPTTLAAPKKPRAVWIGVISTLAAACLLVVLALSHRGGTPPEPLEKNESVSKDIPRPADDAGGLAALRNSRDLEKEDEATFDWPLSEATPLRAAVLAPDLLD